MIIALTLLRGGLVAYAFMHYVLQLFAIFTFLHSLLDYSPTISGNGLLDQLAIELTDQG